MLLGWTGGYATLKLMWGRYCNYSEVGVVLLYVGVVIFRARCVSQVQWGSPLLIVQLTHWKDSTVFSQWYSTMDIAAPPPMSSCLSTLSSGWPPCSRRSVKWMRNVRVLYLNHHPHIVRVLRIYFWQILTSLVIEKICWNHCKGHGAKSDALYTTLPSFERIFHAQPSIDDLPDHLVVFSLSIYLFIYSTKAEVL